MGSEVDESDPTEPVVRDVDELRVALKALLDVRPMTPTISLNRDQALTALAVSVTVINQIRPNNKVSV